MEGAHEGKGRNKALKIAVTGGKGGTGKSTVATALAFELAKKGKVLLMDLDVDCPDDHLLLSIREKPVKDIMQTIPKWDMKKCIKCGKCSKACLENAIVQIKGKYPIFIPEQCIGCNACRIVCPTGAIGKEKKKIGTILKGRGYGIDLITGEMEIGYEEASPIVHATRKFAEKSGKYDYIIIDTAAGTHCNAISALIGTDVAFAVTEPTPLGSHDLALMLDLLKVLKIPSNIVLNRADIGKASFVERVSMESGSPIIASIPYSKAFLEAYSRGKPIEHESIRKIAGEAARL